MCEFCQNHEQGDTLYEPSDWDGGIGFDYIRDIKYCPLCGSLLDGEAKDEPTISKMEQVDEPQTCYTCEYEWRDGTDEPCVYCYGGSKYKPKDEPQTDMAEDIVRSYGFKAESYQQAKAKDEPQPMTDAEITELAKEIVHKMIDNSVIAEDAYPDLKQRMHEAVERLDEYYPSEDERSDQ